MDSLEVEVDVNESYINRVYAKQPVQVTLNAYPDNRFAAEVIAIIPTAEVGDSVPDMWDPLKIAVYPLADGLFEIPEENGLAATAIRATGGATKRVNASGPEREWEFVFHDADEPGSVSVDAGSSNVENSWEYDAPKRILTVHVGRCESVELKNHE